MSIPQLNPSLLHQIDQQFPGFMDWYNLLITYFKTQLDTQGDVTLRTAGKGFEVISPNGTKYRVTVNNAGAWVTTPG